MKDYERERIDRLWEIVDIEFAEMTKDLQNALQGFDVIHENTERDPQDNFDREISHFLSYLDHYKNEIDMKINNMIYSFEATEEDVMDIVSRMKEIDDGTS